MINNSSYEDKTNVMMIKITIHDDCYCYKLLLTVIATNSYFFIPIS